MATTNPFGKTGQRKSMEDMRANLARQRAPTNRNVAMQRSRDLASTVANAPRGNNGGGGAMFGGKGKGKGGPQSNQNFRAGGQASPFGGGVLQSPNRSLGGPFMGVPSGALFRGKGGAPRQRGGKK